MLDKPSARQGKAASVNTPLPRVKGGLASPQARKMDYGALAITLLRNCGCWTFSDFADIGLFYLPICKMAGKPLMDAQMFWRPAPASSIQTANAAIRGQRISCS